MNDTTDTGAETREIPLPPGGGSWTFDRTQWKWISNDPQPETPAADPAPTIAQSETDVAPADEPMFPFTPQE